MRSVVQFLFVVLLSVAPAMAEGLCTDYSGLPQGFPEPKAGMVKITGGMLRMGDTRFYPEERPVRDVRVGDFWIDRHEVTNAQFAAFVAATGYRTSAETGLAEGEYPMLPADLRVPGSMVFVPPSGVLDRMDPGLWWQYVPGADWRHPTGPGSSIAGHGADPVTQVSYADAKAYARWRGAGLPSEAEWEWAARGGGQGLAFAWGEAAELAAPKANFWQGFFPLFDAANDRYPGLAPVGCFPANGYGLQDMVGNVWEWTQDLWQDSHDNVPGSAEQAGPAHPQLPYSRVIKGGSWLCASNFCGRFRPAARQPAETELGSTHIGFRTVIRLDGSP